MKKTRLVIGIAFLALAIVVFVFAEGARRWYSGIFFTIIGVWILVDTLFRPPRSDA